MNDQPPAGSPLGRFWRSWRREIIRGAITFTVVVLAGILVIRAFRAFAAGWDHVTSEFGAPGGNREWHEAFVFSEKLAPGQTVWIRNRSGAVVVMPAAGESLLVVGEKSWRRSGAEAVNIVAVPHPGGVTVCALWEAAEAHCQPRGDYTLSNPRGGDVMVRFTVHVPRGVAVDASTMNGVVDINGIEAPVTAATVNGKVDAEVLRGPFKASTVNGSIQARLVLQPGARPEPVELQTVNGSITAALAPGVNADVEASTVNGKIETDHPVAVSGRLTSRRLEGRIGTGGTTLRLNAVNGSIRLTTLEAQPGAHPPLPPRPPAPAAPPGGVRTKVEVRVSP